MRSVWKCSAACLPSRSPQNPLETRQHLLETRTILQCSHGSVAFARASARDLCDMNGCHFQIIAKNIWHQTYSSTVAPRTRTSAQRTRARILSCDLPLVVAKNPLCLLSMAYLSQAALTVKPLDLIQGGGPSVRCLCFVFALRCLFRSCNITLYWLYWIKFHCLLLLPLVN